MRAATPLLHPGELSARQVLGDFLPRFEAQCAVLCCLHAGQVYHFARWESVWGLIHTLGKCRAADVATFHQYWQQPPTGAPVDVAGAGDAADLTGLSDEELLRHFLRHVACDAALLFYQDRDLVSPVDGQLHPGRGFWFSRWRNEAGRQWASPVGQAWSDWDCTIPCWSEDAGPTDPGLSLAVRSLSPATYPEFIRRHWQEHVEVTQRRAQAYGWPAADVADKLARDGALHHTHPATPLFSFPA